MLTIFSCCVTITFVGCENGNKNIDKNKLTSGEIDAVRLSGESVKTDGIRFSGDEEAIKSRRRNKESERRSL